MNIFKAMRFSLIIIPMIVTGQNLNKDLSKLSYDELKNLYFDSSKSIKEKKSFAKAYLFKAKKENINYRLARGYYWHAYLNYDLNNDIAIKYLDSVIFFSKKEPDTIFPAAAYKERAHLLISNSKYNVALSDFKLAQKYALKNNIDFYYIIKSSIAVTKSEDLGEVEEALEIYRECLNYYKKKNYRSSKYSWYYQQAIFGFADVYKSLKKTDSCSFYNKLGYIESKITKNEDFYSLFILNEGANQILKKNYKATIDSINKSLPILIKLKDKGNILASYYYRGKAHEKMNQINLAVANYKKVDSLYDEYNRINPEFVDGYLYLISHYKNLGDKENQIIYLNKYLKIDSISQRKYKKLYKLIKNEYDIPNLITGKEKTIKSLQNKNKYFTIELIILFIIVSIISFISYLQYRQKKIYKERFKNIISKETIQIKTDTQTLLKTKYEQKSNISDDVISNILTKLNDFENNNKFLECNLTILSLSNQFNTNSRYLSKIINEFKGKTFINYINDLRIDFAINNLQNDNKVRKYTLQALANEYGFNSAESFSTAFSKKTGIKPSYYIKELENKKD